MKSKYRATLLLLLVTTVPVVAAQTSETQEPAGAAQVAPQDCPIANLPYGIGASVADIKAEPQALDIVKRHSPALAAMAKGLPQGLNVIMTLQQAGDLGKVEVDSLALDRDLRAVPVTAEAISRRCARYDNEKPALPKRIDRPAVLLFDKINGFRDAPSVNAAKSAIEQISQRRGWMLVKSDRGGIINAKDLSRFDAVIWNNVSGDALTFRQRDALRSYIEKGGGFAAMHGSGGDMTYLWDWYADTLIGARFIGHPYQPQFQSARISVERGGGSITHGLPNFWTMKDEWYSFAKSPRETGAHVLATLDETSYSPVAFGGRNIAMGRDHPIAWTRCVANGRSFYTAIGHLPESYQDPHAAQLLEQGIEWAMGKGDTLCVKGRELKRRKAIKAQRQQQ